MTSPDFPTRKPCEFRYKGPEIITRSHQLPDLRGGSCSSLLPNSENCTGRRSSNRRARARSALVSSGRQIPTREHRGHLGLSTSGSGIWSLSAAFSRLRDELFGLGNEGIVNLDPHALLRAGVVKNAFIAGISVIAQHESLRRDLDAVRGPGCWSSIDLTRLAALVIHRPDGLPVRLPLASLSIRSSFAVNPTRSLDNVTEREWIVSPSISSAAGIALGPESTRVCLAWPSSVSALFSKTPSTHS